MASYTVETYIKNIIDSCVSISSGAKYRYIYGATFLNSDIKFASNNKTVKEIVEEICKNENRLFVEIDASKDISFNQVDKDGKVVADSWYKKIDNQKSLLYIKNIDAINTTSKQFRMIKEIINFNILKGYKFDREKIMIVLESNVLQDDLYSNTQIVDIKDISTL
jgi:hypothetical protein